MSDKLSRWDRAPKNLRHGVRPCGVALLSLAWIAAGIACGDSQRRPSDLNAGPLDLHQEAPGSDAGSAVETGPGEHSDAGVADLGDAATVSVPDPNTPDGTPRSCGDGLIDPGEECDPGLPATESCEARGFQAGLLGCTVDCQFSTASCSGIEDCHDGRDNDGDGLVDCSDTSDCSGSCTDACLAAVVLPENTTVSGTTLGHPAAIAASCSEAAPSGSEVAYQVTVSEDSKLDVSLSSAQPLNLSLRSSCTQLESELACGSQTRLTLDALAGETYFILVDGASAAVAGEYRLDVRVRQQACGDAIRDAGEECDDGNTSSADGCDSDCLLELSESESNNLRFLADSFNFTPWFAQIDPATDVDYYRVSLTAASSTLVVETLDLGDGACALNAMEPVVDILDTNTNGNALLASDDDGGEGRCSRAVATGLPAGTYYVRVQAAAGAQPETFPYRLEMWLGVCGDGDPTLGEGCDDGNRIAGDGCDANCQVEAGQ